MKEFSVDKCKKDLPWIPIESVNMTWCMWGHGHSYLHQIIALNLFGLLPFKGCIMVWHIANPQHVQFFFFFFFLGGGFVLSPLRKRNSCTFQPHSNKKQITFLSIQMHKGSMTHLQNIEGGGGLKKNVIVMWNCWIHCYNAACDWQIYNFSLNRLYRPILQT